MVAVATGFAIGLSLLVAALGALGIVAPARLLAVGRRFATPGGIWLAAAVRVVLGGALILAAPASRAPALIQGLGIFVVVAGVATPLFGAARLGRVLDWVGTLDTALLRAWSVVVLALGAGFAWALT